MSEGKLVFRLLWENNIKISYLNTSLILLIILATTGRVVASFHSIDFQNMFHGAFITHQSRRLSSKARISTRRISMSVSGSSPQLGKGFEQFSLAPMMDYTDRHYRFLMRLLSKKMVLYTEMVAGGTVINNPEDELGRWLDYNEEVEHPVILQLGGSNIEDLTLAAKRCAPYRYDAINLNCGCPSEKVAGKGCFGAALMRDPELVAAICESMASVSNCPITVKHRIGVDNDDSYEKLCNFITTVSEKAPVSHFIVHARTAILKGLSPAQNREIPPLKYDYVYQLVKDFPHLQFTINGGITTYDQCKEHLSNGVHGVMVGRAINSDPYYWSQVDENIYGTENPGFSRGEVLERYGEYCDRIEGIRGPKVRQTLKKHILNVFAGQKHGKKFRCAMDELVRTDLPLSKVFQSAAEILADETLDAKPGEKVFIPRINGTSSSQNEETQQGEAPTILAT
mmetsp:Transcript_16003/g.21151  ORF Transcript_16003/g.21151 Transcript_16003/m.21151 type:complete len:454 (+) Transcript_16003:40-1401(+)